MRKLRGTRSATCEPSCRAGVASRRGIEGSEVYAPEPTERRRAVACQLRRSRLRRVTSRWALPGALGVTGLVFSAIPMSLGIGIVRADVVPMAPQTRTRTTVDGWGLSVALSGESINTVPNLAGAQNSREAFVTLSASANVSGAGATPIAGGNFVAGYQVGCQTDVSQGLQIGGAGQLSASVGANIGSPTGAEAGGTGSLGGYMQTDLQPGVITTIPMGNMALVTHVGHLDMQDVHLKVDACRGTSHGPLLRHDGRCD